MSTFNEIEMTTPYGDTDNVLELNIDTSSDAYVLQNVIKLPSTYTFSIWYRTEIDSQITFNILGESEIVDSTTAWNKYVKTVTVETLDETSIYIIPSVGVNSYFYEGYLVEGITDTSWLPAPEDIYGEIGSVRSELIQTADSILARVSASDGRITSLETNLDGVTAEITNAKGSSTTLKARLEGIDTSVINAENNAKSFATQEAERIQTTVTQEYKDYVNDSTTTLESNFSQKADEIQSTISKKQDAVAVRYIRDWVNGNDFDDTSSWVECKIVKDGVNLASGIIPTVYCIDEEENEITAPTIDNLSSYTDGNLIKYEIDDTIEDDDQDISVVDETSFITTSFDGNICLQLDLGNTYFGIDYIAIWHDYSEAKSYNHKLEISKDGIEWISLFDSQDGTYIEEESGKYYYFSNELASANMSSIMQQIDLIKAQVIGLNGQIASLTLSSEGIVTRVSTNEEEYNQFLQNEFKPLSETVEKDVVKITDYEGDKTIVTGQIEEIDGKATALQSQVEQNETMWKLQFKKVGVDTDESEDDLKTLVENNLISISMDQNGVSVSHNDDDGIETKTQMTTDGFSGSYNNETIFELNKDYTRTKRVYCANGIDTDKIKIIPMNYTSNGTTYGMITFVKSGGTS